MSNILNIAKERKLQLFFLFYILLILPILSPMAENLTKMDSLLMISVNTFLLLAIFALSLFITSKVQKIVYSLLIAASIIPALNLLAYLLFAHVLLEENSITSLFETNPEESREFIANYLSPWVSIVVIAYVATPIIMVFRMKKLQPIKSKNKKLILGIAISAIIIIFAIRPLSTQVYFSNFYRVFAAYKIRVKKEERTLNERKNISYEVTTDTHSSIPQTIVVVIGESQSKHHLSLYGYARPTNPLLSKIENLHVFKDVVSPQVHTIPVIRSVFTFADNEHPEYLLEKPSLFEVFNRAGYETYFVTNQRFNGPIKASYDDLLSLAKHKYGLSEQKKNDEVVLPIVQQILNTDTTRNKLIVVHLIGNHMAYKFRYPKQYDIFDYKKDGLVTSTPYRDNAARKTIDEYDNSIAYNDYIINSLIGMLSERENDENSLVYFSDHGEEMFNQREFAGHAYEKFSPYMCEIPFMVWVSEKYTMLNPDIVFDVDRPYSTSDFMYSISNLAGLNYKDYNADRSLFSKEFKPADRYIGKHKYENTKVEK